MPRKLVDVPQDFASVSTGRLIGLYRYLMELEPITEADRSLQVQIDRFAIFRELERRGAVEVGGDG